MQTNDTHLCPLCTQQNTEEYFSGQNRLYLRCKHCELVFVPQRYWLSCDKEKTIYDLHDNDVQDQGYRQFLSRLTTPLLERLPTKQQGLDFGCGPGPALAAMLEEFDHQVDLFDPNYQNNPQVFSKQYDFICATEVVEHLREPNKEFSTLFSLLRPNGWLGIMTKQVTSQQAFSQWHYIRDLTHICFYSRSTFEYLAQQFNAEIDLLEKDVILLRKK